MKNAIRILTAIEKCELVMIGDTKMDCVMTDWNALNKNYLPGPALDLEWMGDWDEETDDYQERTWLSVQQLRDAKIDGNSFTVIDEGKELKIDLWAKIPQEIA